MIPQSLQFADGTMFEPSFPPSKRVALSMSGGVESTMLAYLLSETYGPENVMVFSGQFAGRRSWESTHPKMLCKLIGIKHHYAVPQINHHMAPIDNWNMFVAMKKEHGFDSWFNGTNAKLFSPSNISDPDDVEAIKDMGYYVPFVHLEKWQTIELYYLLEQQWLLELTHSCTNNPPEQGHCGQCYCCYERRYGFDMLGKLDPTTYNIPTQTVLENALAFKHK